MNRAATAWLLSGAFLLTLTIPAMAVHVLTPPTYGSVSYAVPSPEGRPYVTTNGNTFLTVWGVNDGLRVHLYGSLADRAGHVSTPVSFLIAPGVAPSALSGFGSNYVVGLLPIGRDPARLAEIAGDGRSLRIIGALPSMTARSIAWNGSHFALVGEEKSPGRTVISILTADGQVVLPPRPLAGQVEGAVLADGSDFLVVTTENSKVLLRRLDTDGRERSVTTVASDARGGSLPSIARSGDTLMLAWDGQEPQHQHAIFLATTDLAGSLRNRSQWDTNALDFSLAATSSAFVLFRREISVNHAQAYDRSAQSVGPDVVMDARQSSAAIDDTIFAAGAEYPRSVHGAPLRVTAQGVEAAPSVLLSTTLRRQAAPRAASGPMDHLVVWSDETAENILRTVIPVASDGRPLAAAQLDVNGPPFGGTPAEPISVSFGRSIFLMVWKEGPTIVGRRMAGSTVLDPNPFQIGFAPLFEPVEASISDQAIAWNGSQFIVLFTSAGQVLSRTVSESGDLGPIRSTGLSGATPRLVWDGSHLVATTGLPRPDDAGVSITRLASDGSPIDPPGANLQHIYGTIRSWHLASNGHDSLIVFNQESRDALLSSDVVSAVIHADDSGVSIREKRTVFEWPGTVSSDVTWDGRNYLLSWRYGNDWLGFRVALARSSSGEAPSSPRAAPAGFPDAFSPFATAIDNMSAPGLTANALGDILIAVSEEATLGDIARVRTYTEADLQPLPPQPSAPVILLAAGTPAQSVITWSYSGDDASFLIEAIDPLSGAVRTVGIAFPGQRQFTASNATLIRVRALTLGGLSEASAIFQLGVRRRAASR